VTLPDELREYMDEPWRSGGLPSPVDRDLLQSRVPWFAEGTAPANGAIPGSQPDLVRKTLMEEGGADYVILLPLTRGMMPNIRREVAVNAATNAWMAGTWLGPKHNHDGRFKGSIRVTPRSPRDAVEQIEQWADHPHFVQIAVPLAAHIPYGQQNYLPIWEAAARHNLPVAIHDDGGGIGIELPPTAVGYPGNFIEAFMMRPFNAAIHLTSLIVEGVFEQFENLVFVFADGSFDAAGALLWRLDKDWKAARSDIPWARKQPTHYLRDHVRFVLQRFDGPSDRESLATAIDIWDGAELAMFGSNYPHWEYLPPQEAMATLPEAAHAKIMGGNAARLYGLSDSAAAGAAAPS
jgi:predicted TIM-barrel fold metal-dependent hydrolase